MDENSRKVLSFLRNFTTRNKVFYEVFMIRDGINKNIKKNCDFEDGEYRGKWGEEKVE